jgi:catechol 2,3-dioxygenase-like lactoylglutathione lyase family enzyme
VTVRLVRLDPTEPDGRPAASAGSARRRGSIGGVDLNHLNLRVRDPEACRAFYEKHFAFRLAFEAEDGYFLRNDAGFLLALVPTADHRALPPGFHLGFGLADAERVPALHSALAAGGVRTSALEDHRPGERYVTFRCWDPDGTEVEVFWDGSLPG